MYLVGVIFLCKLGMSQPMKNYLDCHKQKNWKILI